MVLLNSKFDCRNNADEVDDGERNTDRKTEDAGRWYIPTSPDETSVPSSDDKVRNLFRMY